MKNILDACCGGRSFWFDKANPRVLFIDKNPRGPVTLGKGRSARIFECKPDIVMDFRNMTLKSRSFNLVVFDPPHLARAGKKGYMGMKYGVLEKDTWRDDLRKGFTECFRVLKPNGILVFKWNETHIKLSEILKLVQRRPLFGHKTGKLQKTHWICFMKGV